MNFLKVLKKTLTYVCGFLVYPLLLMGGANGAVLTNSVGVPAPARPPAVANPGLSCNRREGDELGTDEQEEQMMIEAKQKSPVTKVPEKPKFPQPRRQFAPVKTILPTSPTRPANVLLGNSKYFSQKIPERSRMTHG